MIFSPTWAITVWGIPGASYYTHLVPPHHYSCGLLNACYVFCTLITNFTQPAMQEKYKFDKKTKEIYLTQNVETDSKRNTNWLNSKKKIMRLKLRISFDYAICDISLYFQVIKFYSNSIICIRSNKTKETGKKMPRDWSSSLNHLQLTNVQHKRPKLWSYIAKPCNKKFQIFFTTQK